MLGRNKEAGGVSFKLVVFSSSLVFFLINPAKYLRCHVVSNLWHPLHSCTTNASCVSLSDLIPENPTVCPWTSDVFPIEIVPFYIGNMLNVGRGGVVAKSRENFKGFRPEHLLRKANEGWEDHFLPQPMALPEHSKAEKGYVIWAQELEEFINSNWDYC